MEENSLEGKKSLFLVGVLALIFLSFTLSFLLAFFFLKSQKKPSSQKSANTIAVPTPLATSPSSGDSRPAPNIKFGKYIDNSAPSSTSSFLKTYTLKNTFSQDEAVNFAKKLGLIDYKPTINPTMIFSNLSNPNSLGILSFDRNTGTFSFRSFGTLKPSGYTQGQTPTDTTLSLLKDLSLYDETISCNTTYQRKDAPKTTFVECHRDWAKLGAPLVNLGGVLNLPETARLSQSQVGKTDPGGPVDSNIFNVSTGENGKARPNDFNTVTVGIYPDGRIHSIVSSLRLILNIAPSNDVITPNEALTLFEAQKAEFSLTIPAGGGTVDWRKVYPENIAQAKEATIQDFSLVYLDKPIDISQEKYSLSYMIRGTAQLSSGYRVRFAQAIPAVRSELSFKPIAQSVAGESTYLAQAKPLQIGTFNPPTPQPSVHSTTPPSQSLQYTPTSAPTTAPIPRTCDNLFPSAKTLKLQIPEYGELIVYVGGDQGASHTFWYKSVSFPVTGIAQVRDAFFMVVEEQYAIGLARKLLDKSFTLPDFSAALAGQQFEQMLVSLYGPIGGHYEYFQKIQTNLYKRFKSASSSEISSLAQKEDLFPPATMDKFSGIFEYSPFTSNTVGGKSIQNENVALENECYISGVSPALFLYPTRSMHVSVTIGSNLTYSDPAANKNTWAITAFPDGSIQTNNATRPYLYYEYDKQKVSFAEPQEGFVAKKGEWKQTVEKIAGQVGLTKNETQSLATEVQNALIDLQNTPYIKISLIEQTEIDKQLPLFITPKPDALYRIHLMISPVDKPYSLQAPQLSPLKRGNFTVVELGAFANK